MQASIYIKQSIQKLETKIRKGDPTAPGHAATIQLSGKKTIPNLYTLCSKLQHLVCTKTQDNVHLEAASWS